MSRGRRLALLTVLSAPLVIAALVLASPRTEDGLPQPPERPGRVVRASALGGVRARAAQRVIRAEHRRDAHAARGEDARGEPGPGAQTLRLYEHTRTEAEPVARRFFGAFSRYEVGVADETVARELQATATRAFAAELLGAPPRPTGPSKPARARLGRLEFVPGEPDRAGRRLESGELVGVLRRGAAAEPIALALRRRAAGWRVSGLGR